MWQGVTQNSSQGSVSQGWSMWGCHPKLQPEVRRIEGNDRDGEGVGGYGELNGILFWFSVMYMIID